MRGIISLLFLMLSVCVSASSIWVESASRGKEGLFIKSGTFPKGRAAPVSAGAEAYAMDMEYHVQTLDINDSTIVFEPEQTGKYYIYVIDRQVKNGTLHVSLSKTRTYSHTADLGSTLAKEIRGKSESHLGLKPAPGIPFEIIMHKPEKHHHINCCLYSGDTARFEIYYEGLLQKKIPLHVTTQYGWSRRAEADENGMIAFEIPRDHYEDTTVDKRFREKMLLEATYDVETNGTYEGMPYTTIRYSMSMPLTFYTAPLEYASKLPAFLTVIGVMLVFSLGAYYVRRRRRRDHKEIWFEEQ